MLSRKETRALLDPLAPELNLTASMSQLGSLPYPQLHGQGFERLCFELEVAEGNTPRFFGNPGQGDHGVDIMVEDAERRTVIQCKNLGKPPPWSEIEEAIHKFETEWLQEEGLPRPERFIFACPQPLTERSFNKKFMDFKACFFERTGVEILVRDRAYFDARLRALPDLVAGILSEAIAEHFCNVADWRSAPWCCVRRGQERHTPIVRFIQRHGAERLYVAEDIEECFKEILQRSSVVLVRGAPGIGKTLTGLELLTRLGEPGKRLYYSTVKDTPELEKLWQAARMRCNGPAAFVLDDCHLDFEMAGALVQRLDPELSSLDRRTVLLLVARDTPAEGEQLASSELVQRLEGEHKVVDLVESASYTKAVAEYVRPEFAGLSEERVDRLYSSTGGDLLLLEEALTVLDSPSAIDDFDIAVLFPLVLTQCFGATRSLPTVRRLASLAQFDLLPSLRWYEGTWHEGELECARGIINEVLSPPRYKFLHSSMAELIFRALSRLELGLGDRDVGWLQLAKTELTSYFHWLIGETARARCSSSALLRDLGQVASGRLRLCDPVLEAELKVEILADQRLLEVFEEQVPYVSFALLGICLMIVSTLEDPSARQYTALLERKLQLVLEGDAPACNTLEVASLASGLRALARYAPDHLADVLSEVGAASVARFLLTNGTVIELFSILKYATPGFAGELLSKVDEGVAERLVQKTIAAGRSIGTLNLAMRELGKSDEELLAKLEKAMGARRFLRLIEANGTVFELFRIMQYATPGFAGELLSKVDEGAAERLVQKTIAAGRSIGTLHLAMWELGKTDLRLLAKLEKVMGVRRFLRLIEANGTVSELFSILKHATPGFADELLSEVDEGAAERLVQKTIEAGRSIGTLNLAMRELGKSDEELLAKLEKVMGARRFLWLIEANGTVFELFSILKHATPGFADELLSEVDEGVAERLVQKTIEAGRSIGTLSLAMRELGKSDEELLAKLEKAMGARRFLRLIEANGTVLELFEILQNATTGFAWELLEGLKKTLVQSLVETTATSGRSLESAHYTLERLGRTGGQRECLQDRIGVAAWWRLVSTVGTLHSLLELSHAMSPRFRATFVEASQRLTAADWACIIEAGQFRNACIFVGEELSAYPVDARCRFREALSEKGGALTIASTWYDLNTSELSDDLDSPEATALRAALRQRLDSTALSELVGLEFREAVNAFSLVWRSRPALQSELTRSLWEILPPEDKWPSEGGEFAAIRLVLRAACDDAMPQGTAATLLESVCRHLTFDLLTKTHTLSLFLLVWNLSALWREKGPSRAFKGAIPERALEWLCEILQVRTEGRRSRDERLAQLALGGMVCVLDADFSATVRSALRPLAPAIPELLEDLLASTFVPAFFALEGIALLRPEEQVLAPTLRATVVSMADEYERVGPAVAELRDQLVR